jgi:hypothetical protein
MLRPPSNVLQILAIGAKLLCPSRAARDWTCSDNFRPLSGAFPGPLPSGIATSERKGRHVDVPRWVVLLKGSDPAAIKSACDELMVGGLETHGGAGPFVRGLYALEISCAKSSGLGARAEEDRSARPAHGKVSWAANPT